MKITINKDQLLLGLSRVLGAISTNVSMPILCSVLLDAKDGQLKVSGTSLDLASSTSVKANVSEPGSIALPAKRIQQIASSMPGEEVSISVKGLRATISAGKSVFHITGMDAADFPPLASACVDNAFDCAATQLLSMLSSVSYAASKDPSRFVLMGVKLTIKDKKLMVAATDGVRLAFNEKALDAEHNAGVIIPTGTVSYIQSLLKDAITAKVTFNDRGIYFTLVSEGGETHVSSKVVQANYPDTSRVIPKSYKHKITVPREAFVDALRRVSLATSDKTTYVKYSADGGALHLFAASAENGEANDDISITEQDAIPMFALSHRFVMDCVESMACETFTMEYVEHLSPVVFRNDDKGFLYVCMPQKVS